MSKINVVELFKAVQGEGNEVGKITTFVRLGGCSFRCSWCDSKHTWEPGKHGEMLEIKELVQRIKQLGTRHVTLTGGNPAIWQTQMTDLLTQLKQEGYVIAMETQGDIYRSWMHLVDNMVISPKNIDNLPLTIEAYQNTIEHIIKLRHGKTTIIKSPIFNQKDLDWFKQFVNFEGNYQIYLSVGNDWTDETDVTKLRTQLLDRYRWIIETVLEDKWFIDRHTCVVPQMHVLAYDNRPLV